MNIDLNLWKHSMKNRRQSSKFKYLKLPAKKKRIKYYTKMWLEMARPHLDLTHPLTLSVYSLLNGSTIRFRKSVPIKDVKNGDL